MPASSFSSKKYSWPAFRLRATIFTFIAEILTYPVAVPRTNCQACLTLLAEHLHQDGVDQIPVGEQDIGALVRDDPLSHIAVDRAAVDAIRAGTQQGQPQPRPEPYWYVGVDGIKGRQGDSREARPGDRIEHLPDHGFHQELAVLHAEEIVGASAAASKGKRV